jgi:hypothetical protein
MVPLCAASAISAPSPSNNAPLQENQKKVSLTFQGASYADLINNPTKLASFNKTVSDSMKAKIKTDSGFDADVLVTSFAPGSVVAVTQVTFPAGTSAAAIASATSSITAAVAAGTVFTGPFLAQYGITGVVAVDVIPAAIPAPPPASTPTTPSSDDKGTPSSDDKGKWLGAGIGIGIAIMVFVVLVAGGIWFMIQRRETQTVQPKAFSA